MAKVNFEIPDKVIDEASKKRIKDLERQLKNAENREKKAKDKLAEQEYKLELAQTVLNRFRTIIEELQYEEEYADLFRRDGYY